MRGLLATDIPVIELGESLAGSYCGTLLRHLGARVSKIEAPEGSPLRSLPPFVASDATGGPSAPYVALTAGKEILRAELSSDSTRTAVGEVLDADGMVIMSGPRAAWRELGYDPGEMLARFPRALIGRVTLFGEEGPYTDLVGGELQVQALGGLMNMVGEPPREPLRLGGYPAQYATGLALFSGFGLAQFRRSAVGRGSEFATSVLETVANIEWKGAVSYQDSGEIVTRGSDGAPAILRAQDGFVAFFYRPNDWPKVVAIMQDTRLEADQFASQALRNANRRALLSILNECAGHMSKRDFYHKTQSAGMTTGYMATMSDLLESPQYTAREFFADVQVDGKNAKLPGPPWRIVSTDAPIAVGPVASSMTRG
jgi:crotonobetainyl-CoA:carnitine CoA-transferase CaiB-like acyl-CoA transferase